MNEEIKIKINKAIEYVKQISVQEPTNFQIEEVDANIIVISFTYKQEYLWSQRQYKQFVFNGEDIVAMKSFGTPDQLKD